MNFNIVVGSARLSCPNDSHRLREYVAVQAKARATPQLIGVQYLRAIAALMVAYYHALDQIPQYLPYLNRYLLGKAHLANGVDLFFVISGFLITTLLLRERQRSGSISLRRF